MTCLLGRESSSLDKFASVPVFLGTAFATAHVSSITSAEGYECNALEPKQWRSFRVHSNEKLTHNTHKLRIDFPRQNDTSGLTVASFLMAKATLNGKNVMRPYTPTSPNSEKGYLELVVKGYPTGVMSKHLVTLQAGDSIELKGPLVKFSYEPNSRKHIGMIAGGSGITPMLQVALEILRNPEDRTEVTLIFANQTEEDIILRDELASYEKLYPGFKVIHVLSKPSPSWDGPRGYVSKELVQKYMPDPSSENLVLVCGPPGMMSHVSGGKAKDYTQGALEGLLKELNYTSEIVFKF